LLAPLESFGPANDIADSDNRYCRNLIFESTVQSGFQQFVGFWESNVNCGKLWAGVSKLSIWQREGWNGSNTAHTYVLVRLLGRLECAGTLIALFESMFSIGELNENPRVGWLWDGRQRAHRGARL